MDAPSEASVKKALEVLHSLNAIDKQQQITGCGSSGFSPALYL